MTYKLTFTNKVWARLGMGWGFFPVGGQGKEYFRGLSFCGLVYFLFYFDRIFL